MTDSLGNIDMVVMYTHVCSLSVCKVHFLRTRAYVGFLLRPGLETEKAVVGLILGVSQLWRTSQQLYQPFVRVLYRLSLSLVR